MAKMFQVYGIGQALIPVLPPPIPFENAPTSNQTNYEVGQIVYTPGPTASAFYIYAGAGNWINLTDSDGPVQSVLGTANQITVTTVAGVATVSLPAAITTPGSLTTTTTLAAGTALSSGTTITAGTSITATLGNITATNGNLVLSTAGNKISIATGANATVGTSSAMTAGAVTVANTSVTASSKIFAYPAVLGTVTVPQAYYISAITPATSFVITSQDATDTSTWNYWIVN